VRASKYLNNLIEQDHRRVKQRIYWMLGFKRFSNAAIVMSGIELTHRIRKKQFDTPRTGQNGARSSQIWEAVLAA
jgi:transposase-like protein